MRKIPMVTGEVYHVYSKSIAGFKIFNTDSDSSRMIDGFRFFRAGRKVQSFSWVLRNDPASILEEDRHNAAERLVQVIAYCVMPTHFHLLLRQQRDRGISLFMSQLLNSYSKYYNLKHNRKGPLWESEFRGKHVADNDIAQHMTRYIHLNPVTAFLTDAPEGWKYSSYHEFIGHAGPEERLTDLERFPVLSAASYVKYVHDRIDYQRLLKRYKDLYLDGPDP